jgi:hypothetical protein
MHFIARLLTPAVAAALLACSKCMVLLETATEERQNIHCRREAYLLLPSKNAHRYWSRSKGLDDGVLSTIVDTTPHH